MGYERTSVPGIFKRGETYSVAYRDTITRKTRFRTAGKTLREAKALKRELENAREQGHAGPDAQMTFGQLWSEFEELHLGMLSPSTRADYTSIANRYLLVRYRLAYLGAIDRTEVLRFRDELLRTKGGRDGATLSPKRVKNIIVCLQSVLQFAVETERLRSNPARGLRRSGLEQEPETRRAFLTPEEVSELLRSVKQVNIAYYPLFLTLSQTGMRLSECLALPAGPEGIGLVRRRIHITRSVYRGELKAPKNGKSRTVGVSDTLYEVLLEHLQGKEGGLAFASRRDGGFIDPNGLRRHVWDRAVERSNLPEEKKATLTIHSLRHSAASHLVEQGLPVSTILELFGWSSPKLLLRYAHADANRAADTGAAAVENLV